MRGIPPVRTWKVTLCDDAGRAVDACFIDTINKRFARMLAIERYGWWGRRLRVSPSRRPKVSWKPEVFVQGEWSGNALRFATREESDAYAKDLMGRWTLVRDTRSVESSEPVTHEWSESEGIGPIGGAKRFPARRVSL